MTAKMMFMPQRRNRKSAKINRKGVKEFRMVGLSY